MPIEFLCPNGHHLSGPSHLQGRAGQCPHCGEKFQIPVIDDADDESRKNKPSEDEPIKDFADDDVATVNFADAGPLDESDHAALDADEPEMFDEEPIKAFDEEDPDDDPVVSFASDGDGPSSAADEIHPLCELFEMLWEEKQHGASIQIFLGDDDDPFEPQWYSPALSQASHALFARQNADEKYTLTAIAWDAMERIEVGKLDELPQDAFE